MEPLSPFVNQAFSEYNQDRGEVAAATSDEIIQETSGHLHDFYGKQHMCITC